MDKEMKEKGPFYVYSLGRLIQYPFQPLSFFTPHILLLLALPFLPFPSPLLSLPPPTLASPTRSPKTSHPLALAF